MAQTPEMRRCILISMVGVLLLFSGCTGRPDGIKPVSPFDINRYQGVWYEIMRLDHSFERGLTNVTATYILRDDGMVDVLNKGFDRKQCRWKEALGIASFQGKETVASLSVTFFGHLPEGITFSHLMRRITATHLSRAHPKIISGSSQGSLDYLLKPGMIWSARRVSMDFPLRISSWSIIVLNCAQRNISLSLFA